MKDNNVMIAVFVAVLCFALLTMKRAVADDGVMAGGFVCYTSETVAANLEEAFAYGEHAAAQEFFENVSIICASGQAIDMPGIGILSCEGVK